MVAHIKLYGGKSELFEDIKDQMTDRFGYEPTNPEVVGILMSTYTATENAPTQ